MIGRLNHVAIAVPDLEAASALYRGTLGAVVSEPVDQPEHGVTTVFIALPNTKIELLLPLGEDQPIARFLERNPAGGIHHICYEVADIGAARDRLVADGHRVRPTVYTPYEQLAPEMSQVEFSSFNRQLFLHNELDDQDKQYLYQTLYNNSFDVASDIHLRVPCTSPNLKAAE